MLELYSSVSLKIYSKNIHVFTKSPYYVVMGTLEDLFEYFIIIHYHLALLLRKVSIIIHHIALVLVPVLAATPPLALDIGLLDNKDTTVNGVDDNVTRFKGVGRPGTSVPESVTAAGLDIIRRVDIEVGNLLDLGAVRELGDAGDVKDTETSLVVGLVVKTVVDVLVVVDRAGGSLVVAGDDGLLKVLDVPNVGHGETILGGTVDSSAVGVDLALVKLIVHDDVSLPVGVENPTLMGVGSSDVGCARDDGTGVTETLLVGDVVDGQCVLVVTVADVTAVVLLVRSTVDNALSVVSVAVLAVATLDVRLGGVVHVDEHGSTSTGVVATGTTASTAGDGIVLLLVGDDSVGTALDTLVDVDKGSVLLDVESVRLLGRELEQLLQVKDLDVVTNTLGTNNEAVTNDLDLTPNNGVVVGGKASKVLQLTVLGNFGERSTVSLTDSNLIGISFGSLLSRG